MLILYKGRIKVYENVCVNAVPVAAGDLQDLQGEARDASQTHGPIHGGHFM